MAPLLVGVGRWVVMAFALVDLTVSAQVGDDGEVTAATIDIAGECYMMSVVMHDR